MQNVSFFDCVRTSPFRSKKHSFLSRRLKNVSLWPFFAQKKKKRDKGRFFDKNYGLTPLQNVDFFDLFRTSLFRSKKHCFLSRISKNVSLWLFFAKKKNIWEKGRFFDKNHGLTPLQNVVFFRLCENFIFEVKKTLCSFQNLKNVSLLLFAEKKIYKKKVDFLTKTMD